MPLFLDTQCFGGGTYEHLEFVCLHHLPKDLPSLPETKEVWRHVTTLHTAGLRGGGLAKRSEGTQHLSLTTKELGPFLPGRDLASLLPHA